MSAEEKEQWIDDALEQDDWSEDVCSRLEQLAGDANDIVRMRAAEALVFAPPNTAEPILLRLLGDGEELVRVNAADSLCTCASARVFDALVYQARHDVWLVRGYAVLSLSDIAKINGEWSGRLREFLMTSIRKERNRWVRVHYDLTLYELGDLTRLFHLISGLYSRYYHVRIVAAKSLQEIADETNVQCICAHLKARLAHDVSARQALQEAVDALCRSADVEDAKGEA